MSCNIWCCGIWSKSENVTNTSQAQVRAPQVQAPYAKTRGSGRLSTVVFNDTPSPHAKQKVQELIQGTQRQDSPHTQGERNLQDLKIEVWSYESRPGLPEKTAASSITPKNKIQSPMPPPAITKTLRKAHSAGDLTNKTSLNNHTSFDNDTERCEEESIQNEPKPTIQNENGVPNDLV